MPVLDMKGLLSDALWLGEDESEEGLIGFERDGSGSGDFTASLRS